MFAVKNDSSFKKKKNKFHSIIRSAYLLLHKKPPPKLWLETTVIYYCSLSWFWDLTGCCWVTVTRDRSGSCRRSVGEAGIVSKLGWLVWCWVGKTQRPAAPQASPWLSADGQYNSWLQLKTSLEQHSSWTMKSVILYSFRFPFLDGRRCCYRSSGEKM